MAGVYMAGDFRNGTTSEMEGVIVTLLEEWKQRQAGE